MTAFYIFVLRVTLGAVFAVLATRFFYPRATIQGIMAVAVVLVGMAYVMEYFRKRKKRPTGKDDH